MNSQQETIALERIKEIGGSVQKAENPCLDCASLPACRQVSKAEHKKIKAGSPTCQLVADSEEESGIR